MSSRLARRTTLESYVTQAAHSSRSGPESPPAPCRLPLRIVVPSNRVLNGIPIVGTVTETVTLIAKGRAA